MGRPWWYDSYWEQRGGRRKRRFRPPSRQAWTWIGLVVLSLVLAMNSTGFRPDLIVWLLAFVNYICRILSLAVMAWAILSWFVDPRSFALVMLRELTEPVVSPLRKVVPLLGTIDITPLIAIVVLNLLPSVFAGLLGLLR